MLERALSRVLALEAGRMPIVTVTGPRQSGKTTLVRNLFPEHQYVSLERPDEKNVAIADPLAFLARYPKGVIIDEVQRVPDLLSYIQVNVDEDDRAGRFILTGSQNLLLMQRVSQSLAGRTAVFHLLPLALTELESRAPLDLEQLIESSAKPYKPSRSIWETVWTGFYPRIHDKGLDPQRWLADYHRTYVERDVREILNVMDTDGFERFVRLVAANTAQELNLSSLAADAGISQPAAKQWLAALRTSWLVAWVQPHFANFRKRLRKRPKLHFLDSGLVCYLLGISSPEILANHPLRGAVFESFIFAELFKAFIHRGRDAPLYHWRDATGHEIDLIVDLGDRLIPIEIKSGTTFVSDMAKSINWWLSIKGNPNQRGALVYGGDRTLCQRGVSVFPWWIG